MSEINSNYEPKEIPEVAQETPGIGVQDIVALLNIVDVVTRRGAFRAEELSSVGAIYDKVAAFLKASGALSTAEEGTVETIQPEGTDQ